jgi:hypothetical protein
MSYESIHCRLAAKHKTQRNELRAAMSSLDQQLLQQAVQQFQASGTPDKKEELQKAKDLLLYLQLSERRSFIIRNTSCINLSLHFCRNHSYINPT